jgi:hypothetical protein
MLTYRVAHRIERGAVGVEHLDEVKELERDVWSALEGYCRGCGFAEAIDGSS